MYKGFNLTIKDDSIFSNSSFEDFLFTDSMFEGFMFKDSTLENLMLEDASSGHDFMLNNHQDHDTDNPYYKKGIQMYETFEKCSISHLKRMLSKAIIDGDTLQQTWFPDNIFLEKNFVFISHSSSDRVTAIKLAGYLYAKFHIYSFIDSCVWRHIDELNKILNDCSTLKNEDCHYCDCKDFSYNLSYVHMMLASALTSMIDKCECMFFLNTPSSININKKTESPWIYFELNIVNTIQKTSKIEPVTESSKMEFTPKLGDLTDIDEDFLTKWEKKWKTERTFSSADPFAVLYEILVHRKSRNSTLYPYT